MANMLAFQCKYWDTSKDYWARCNWHILFREDQDPTTSTGCCPGCGNAEWEIWETDMSETEYFKQMLTNPHRTIGYQHIRRIS